MLLINSNEDYEGGLKMVKEARVKIEDLLKSKPNVHGSGIGYRRNPDGSYGNELCLVVLVSPLPEGEPVSRDYPNDLGIPETIEVGEGEAPRGGLGNTVGTQIEVMPMPVRQAGVYAHRVRPVKGGYSIGPRSNSGAGAVSSGSSGTLGGFAWDNAGRRVVMLTNAHVAGTNLGGIFIQPSRNNGGEFPRDYIGRVVRVSYELDAAIIEPVTSLQIAHQVEEIGAAIFAVAEPQLNQVVAKVGQKTGKTRGRVTLVNHRTTFYQPGVSPEDRKWYYNDMVIESLEPDGAPFTAGGDSGSLYVLEPEGGAQPGAPVVVGLHWGGLGAAYSIGHPIKDVFVDLNLAIACSGNIRELINNSSGTGPRGGLEYDELGNPRGEVLEDTFSRDLEAQLLAGEKGRLWLEAVGDNRAAIVELMYEGQGGGSLIAAFGELIAPGAGVYEVMNTPLTTETIAAFALLMENALNLNPGLGGLVAATNAIFADGEGKTLAQLIQ